MGASTKDLLSLTEGILADSAPVKEVPVTNQIIDDGLKAIVVPDSYVDQILGFAGSMNESTTAEEVSDGKALVEAKVLEQKVQSLIERLKSLLNEAKHVLKEMTTTGSIGVGTQKKMMVVKDECYPPKPAKSMGYGKKVSNNYGSHKSNKRG